MCLRILKSLFGNKDMGGKNTEMKQQQNRQQHASLICSLEATISSKHEVQQGLMEDVGCKDPRWILEKYWPMNQWFFPLSAGSCQIKAVQPVQPVHPYETWTGPAKLKLNTHTPKMHKILFNEFNDKTDFWDVGSPTGLFVHWNIYEGRPAVLKMCKFKKNKTKNTQCTFTF